MKNSEQNYTLIENFFCLAPTATNIYMRAYTFRYKTLFHKAFRAVQQVKHIPAKSIYFSLWKESTQSYEALKNSVYQEHFQRSLLSRSLRRWKIWKVYRQTKSKYLERSAQTRNLWLVKTVISGLKKAVQVRHRYTQFMIKRYRGCLLYTSDAADE